MLLSPGDRVGPYEVVGELGAGGMGEVYRARDTRLDRTVALKVLPQLFTDDAERRARFEREAKVLAALNHPNIAQVYGFESNAIAMEFVDGQTLEDVIRATTSESPPGLPLDRALSIARQIAAALETAHDQGIVHRDLKPANIKIREDGTVKVLDFGLAKALAPDGEGATSGVSNSPTLTARSTQLGMILGTAAYMAPEQAKGRAIDRRADVWAFGAVLFEMLGGRRAFQGDDVSDVLAAVLKTEPEWAALPNNLPAPVLRLLRRCLEKDPKRRLRDVAEGMLQLDDGFAAAAATPIASAIRGGAGTGGDVLLWRRVLAVAVTVIATAAVVVGIERWGVPPPVQRTPVRFLFEPPKPLWVSAAVQDLTISPDGKTIVYSASESREPGVWIHHLDQLDAAPLRGGERGVNPTVSSDNAWVAFLDYVDPSVLRKVSILGGPPVHLTKAKHEIAGVTWTHDGAIVLGGSVGPLQIIPDGGGDPKDLTTLATGEAAHRWPSEVPGTSVVLFTLGGGAQSAATTGQLAAIDRATGRTVRLGIPGLHPRYVPSGHVIYGAADGSMQAIAFDPKTMTTSGNPVPILQGIDVKASGLAQFDVATDGRLVYASSGIAVASPRSLVWIDRTGKETQINAPPRPYVYVRLSPDGSRLAADVRSQEQNVWIWDFARETLLRLTDRHGSFQYCLWTPDSQRIVFYSSKDDVHDLFQMRADGTGTMDRVTDTSADKLQPYPNAVTPDGRQIVFRASTVTTQDDLYIASLTGGVSFKTLLATEHDERNASISPDGKWMAFESDLSGRFEIYVRPFPGVEASQFTVSAGGGIKPAWSPTGKEIFYIANDNQMMAVPVDTTRGYSAGKPVALFDTSPYFSAAIGRNYDVSNDGKRFVFPKLPATAAGHVVPITVVLDWVDELRSRVK